MGKSYNPGDVFVNYLTLQSPRGSLNLTNIFISAKIYESVFTPGVVGHYEILDTEDYIGSLKLAGDETVSISFLPPGGTSVEYVLNLNSVDDVETLGSMKAKIYRLSCFSKEALVARASPVTKSYNTQLSNIVQDVFSKYLNSSKPIDVEPTKGIQQFIATNLKPFQLLDQLRHRAVSLTNKSSNYLFFETSKGYNFKTLEGLTKGDVVKYFKQEDTVGTSINSQMSNNIISHKLHKQMSAIDRIGLGSMNHQVQTFDIRTKSYKIENKKPTESDFGITGPLSSAIFKSLFGSTSGKNTFITKDSVSPETYLKDSVADKNAFLAAMMQSQLNIEVPGDTAVKAGDCVYCHIPKRVSTTGLNVDDPLINGKFLVTKLAHLIHRPDTSPRYTNSLELVKAGYETGV